MKPDEPQFQLFEQWCETNGVDMTGHQDNWEHFWYTWNDGFKAGIEWSKGMPYD